MIMKSEGEVPFPIFRMRVYGFTENCPAGRERRFFINPRKKEEQRKENKIWITISTPETKRKAS